MKWILNFVCIIIFSSSNLFSQQLTQTVRGVVTDKDTKTPLIGVNVIILNTLPLIGATTDANGEFLLKKVPVGRRDLQVTYVGYKNLMINNIEINSGKEVVLNLNIEEDITSLKEVAVTAYKNKTQGQNEMSTISSRTFSVEESGRYAGSRNDVSRMASNYAGVTNGDDSRNDIVIRGNSPNGLLWKLEEMEIPSPNHFTGVGSSGGPVSMLNYNVISNSDFMTGAFPAEFGNATSGVFDIKLRNGNNKKREYMFQAGALGTELMFEGPYSSNYGGSYLFNYRFSTTTILTQMGVKFGYSGKADYQDLSYNLNFPVGDKATLSFFGMGGYSVYKALYKDKKEADFSPTGFINTNNYYVSGTGVAGVSLMQRINENTYIKTIAGISGVSEEGKEDSVALDYSKEYPRYRANNYQYKLTFHSYIKSKINARNKFKLGLIADQYTFDMVTKFRGEQTGLLAPQRLGSGSAVLYQAYGQWAYSFTDNLVLNSGLHYQYFALNNDQMLEPRVGLKWSLNQKQSLTFGYGLHGQTQILPLYFVTTPLGDDFVNTNRNLKFSKSHQYIIGYSYLLASNTAFKVETYYQQLYDIPVNRSYNPTSFSAINEGMSYVMSDEDSLVNNGTGRNVGVEVTLERFFSKGYYYLFTASVFDSKYKGSDGKERNTAYNGRYVFNILGGKEFKVSDRSKILVDIKLSTSGGKRYTPIDESASAAKGSPVRIDEKAFTQQFKDYFRADLKVTYRFNGFGKSHELFINIDNVLNTQNVFAQTYNARTHSLENIYQLGLFPTFQYKVYF